MAVTVKRPRAGRDVIILFLGIVVSSRPVIERWQRPGRQQIVVADQAKTGNGGAEGAGAKAGALRHRENNPNVSGNDVKP